MNNSTTPKPFLFRILVGATLHIALMTAALRAEPLPPELNLIPRDAALFISIRPGDLWNDPRIKPLRDAVELNPELLRNFEKELGFRPTDLEQVTILVPGFNPHRGPSEPCFVVTLAKPYDLEKLLDAMNGMTIEEWRRSRGPLDGGFAPVPFKTVAPPPMKREFKAVPPAPKPKRELKEDPKETRRDEAPGKDEVLVLAENGQPEPAPKAKAKKRDLKAAYYVVRERSYLVPINDRTFVICMNNPYGGGSMPDLLAALLRTSEDGPLSPALEIAAQKHPIVAGCNLRAIKDALPADEVIDLLPIQSILSSRTATLVADIGGETKLTLRIDAGDAETAKRVRDLLKAFQVLSLETLPGAKKQIAKLDQAAAKEVLAAFGRLLQNAQFELDGATAAMTMQSKDDLIAWAAMLKGVIQKVQEAAEKAKSMNNMKQLVLAVYNYSSAYQDRLPFDRRVPVFPKFKLSWRVALLPFIEQAALYNEFHLDEPWDSEHNIKLLEKMPKIYAPPPGVSAAKGQTFYRVFTGAHTISNGYKIGGIPDGTSNTIMIVEAGESVPWTKPDEFPFDREKPLPKLGGHSKGKMMVGMCDGSVRVIDLTKVSERTLKLAIQADDGEVMPSDW